MISFKENSISRFFDPFEVNKGDMIFKRIINTADTGMIRDNLQSDKTIPLVIAFVILMDMIGGINLSQNNVYTNCKRDNNAFIITRHKKKAFLL